MQQAPSYHAVVAQPAARRTKVVRSVSVLRRIAFITVALGMKLPAANADLGPGPEEALNKKIAVWRFDALGIDPEIVLRLETLFRMEIDRLDREQLPSRKDIESKITASEQNCTGEEKCLTAIGKRLRVDYMVTGTVGSLGDTYILHIRAVEVPTGKVLHITSDPLRGTPDELIEGVRVAAYRLLAPDQLLGALQLESDLAGADVVLDGSSLGRTPLPEGGLLRKIPLGKHRLRVQAPGYAAWEDQVDVHFQKVTPVAVRLVGPPTQVTANSGPTRQDPIYSRPWFLLTVGVAAIALGGYVGYRAGHVNCHVYPSGDSC